MTDDARQHREMQSPAVRRSIPRPCADNMRDEPPGSFYAPTANLRWLIADAGLMDVEMPISHLYQLWRSPYTKEPELWVKVTTEWL